MRGAAGGAPVDKLKRHLRDRDQPRIYTCVAHYWQRKCFELCHALMARFDLIVNVDEMNERVVRNFFHPSRDISTRHRAPIHGARFGFERELRPLPSLIFQRRHRQRRRACARARARAYRKNRRSDQAHLFFPTRGCDELRHALHPKPSPM